MSMDCAFQCPSDMVRIGDRVACIDKYEATIYADNSCSGTRYGASSDDYPSGFRTMSQVMAATVSATAMTQ